MSGNQDHWHKICPIRYPKAQQVTYKFYVGRKHMFDNDFKAADQYLTYAFEHCHANSHTNKR